MKQKPDISGFARPAKDPTAFLEGALADRSERPGDVPPPAPGAAGSAPGAAGEPPPDPPKARPKPEPTVQKLFRLRWDTANALRDAAARQSLGQAKRVTETEIVEALIRRHLRLDS